MWKVAGSGLLLLAAFYVLGLYYHLCSVKRTLAESWQALVGVLRQRDEVVSCVLAICAGQSLYSVVRLPDLMDAASAELQALNDSDVLALANAERILQAGMLRIFSVAHAAPAMPEVEQLRHLEQRLRTLNIAFDDWVKIYNDSVELNNILQRYPPDRQIAAWFRMEQAELLEIAPWQPVQNKPQQT